MWFKELYLLVPARKNAPKAKLYVRIVAENENSLDSKPYIFMLPGGPGANHSHYKAYECLSSIGNVVFFDPRGCGLSDKNLPTTYNMDNYIKDVEEIRKQLNLGQIILLGKSYGAMCALGYTLENPQYVAKLILAAGSPSYRNLKDAEEYIQSFGSKEQQLICKKLWSGTFANDEEVNDYFDKMDTMYSWKKRHNFPTQSPKADYPFAHAPLNEGFSNFLRTFDYEDRLGEVSCPTLILVGEEDWITNKKHSIIMANKIPNSKLIIFNNADHAMELDAPEVFFKSIENFVISNHLEKTPFQFFQSQEPLVQHRHNDTELHYESDQDPDLSLNNEAKL
ncbi:alpha/beta fold hydrolase [Legionella sp. CNM-1927-20]|uniref:alpha/beta fold hydrolase n=1 Tax=Legionella sp. CNM-1927-20 TaxID=3422221 RepID=UPI00403B2532